MSKITKLPPPKIDPIIPAMLKEVDNSQQNDIIFTIPFQISTTISANDMDKVVLRIKTVSTGRIKIDNLENDFFPKYGSTLVYESTFSLKPDDWMVGQYYKVQLALKSKWSGEIGNYSDVGIVKCISKPSVSIQNLEITANPNQHLYEYVGMYTTADLDEKIYSYTFTIYDGAGRIYDTSGVQLHNANSDTKQNESIDKWVPTKSLQANTEYNIVYSVTTMSGGVVTSGSYSIMYSMSGELELGTSNAEFCGVFYEEDAYVDLRIKPIGAADVAIPEGSYVVSRASDEDNFENWVQLFTFTSTKNIMNPQFGYDYTVAQGVQYKYILQSIKDGKYSLPLEATYYLNDYNTPMTDLKIDFEHAYLFDGEKQLCIKYNPKISSFKTTMLESKMDTIGGQYPFIFKNGNVAYKEFPISGLISVLMDSNHTFLDVLNNDMDVRTKTPDAQNNNNFQIFKTTLERDNFRAERDFKLQVLQWLTNGSIKLFRSPGEGNYIVRLMNTSLSPNDTLSRMLHTFSATAYEIADYTVSNLKLYNFIKEVSSENVAYEMIFNELSCPFIFYQKDISYSFTSHGGARYLEFKNQYSDFIVQVVRMNGNSLSFNVGNVTGGYFFQDLESNPVIKVIYISGTPDDDATMVIGHYGYSVNSNETTFSLRKTNNSQKGIKTDVVQQFIGGPQTNGNLISIIEETGTLGVFYLIQARPKTIVKVVQRDGRWYPAVWYEEQIRIYNQVIDPWDTTALYYDIENDVYYCGNCDNPLQGMPDFTFSLNNNDYYSTLATVNKGDFIDRKDFESIKNVESAQTLQIGNGVLCNVVYQLTPQ